MNIICTYCQKMSSFKNAVNSLRRTHRERSQVCNAGVTLLFKQSNVHEQVSSRNSLHYLLSFSCIRNCPVRHDFDTDVFVLASSSKALGYIRETQGLRLTRKVGSLYNSLVPQHTLQAAISLRQLAPVRVSKLVLYYILVLSSSNIT